MKNFGYSSLTLEHFYSPRNVGNFAAEDNFIGTGLAGTVERGDVVCIQLQVNAQARVTAAKFKAYGSPATIATCSWLTEWVQSKDLAVVEALSGIEIADILQLPPHKLSAALLVEEALKIAVVEARCKLNAIIAH